jgi:hypothetical protein
MSTSTCRSTAVTRRVIPTQQSAQAGPVLTFRAPSLTDGGICPDLGGDSSGSHHQTMTITSFGERT